MNQQTEEKLESLIKHVKLDLLMPYLRIGEALEILRAIEHGGIVLKSQKQLAKTGVHWLEGARKQLKEVRKEMQRALTKTIPLILILGFLMGCSANPQKATYEFHTGLNGRLLWQCNKLTGEVSFCQWQGDSHEVSWQKVSETNINKNIPKKVQEVVMPVQIPEYPSK